MKLSVENGCFSYPHGGREVLKNINFSAQEGDMVAILGPNGAGKTTLLRCIMGFLRWGAGASLLDDRNIRDIPYRELWQAVAYVPQARGVASSSTALEMVLLGRGSRVGLFAKPGAADLEAAQQAMRRLHIEHLESKRCSEMSGGELQMVLIARALASDPHILILDEPESNLDFKNQLLVLNAMSELTASGMTCIFNTHYPAHALQRAGKALLLSKGGESLFGQTHAVVTERNIQKAFGVRAVIGELETPSNMVHDVVALEICERGSVESDAEEQARRELAVVSIISQDFEISSQINELLHEVSQHIVGRMGMPYRDMGLYIINVTLDAPAGVVQALCAKLNVLPGVAVKATYPRETASRGDVQPKKEA